MSEATSLDAILGGKVRLKQLRAGHRVGADAVLLAAAAGPEVPRLVDVGAGAGAVALVLLTRWRSATASLVEMDSVQAALAQENLELNGVADRGRVVEADVLSAPARRAAGLAEGGADLVLTNPPFFAPGASRVSPVPAKASAHVFSGAASDPLAAWLRASLALLRPGGRFVMIHRADALGPILAGIGRRLGAVAIRPIHPKAEAPAIRVLVSGIKGSKAPLAVLPGIALHEASGAFTPLAEAVHRGEALL